MRQGADEMTTARPSPSEDQADGERHPDATVLPLSLPPLHPCRPRLAAQQLNSAVCLSPELSLDVDADRDGVVEKNNPKKVPRYQGRLTRAGMGVLGRAPGWT